MEKDFILKSKKKNFYLALDEEVQCYFGPNFFFETRLNDNVLKKQIDIFLRGYDELELLKRYKPKLKNFNLRVIGHPKYDLLKPKYVIFLMMKYINKKRNSKICFFTLKVLWILKEVMIIISNL